MARLLLVLGLLSLALANPLDFHREYLKKILPADTPHAVTDSDITCAKYICNTGTPYVNNTCVFPFEDNVYLQKCPSGDFCPTALSPVANATCMTAPTPGWTNGLPGDACSNEADCGSPYNTCEGNICEGLPDGSFCNDQGDCNVGSFCNHESHGPTNSTCQKLIVEGGACPNDLLYLNDQYCGNGSYCSLGTCITAFSRQAGDFVDTHTAHFACDSGFFNTPPPGPGQTFQNVSFSADPPRSPSVSLPISCNAGDMCYSADRQHMAVCECGINPTGQGYCPLFPGDDQYLNYFNALKAYLGNARIDQCHFLNIGQELCGADVSTFQQLNTTQREIQWYINIQGNTDCIKSTYTSGYWYP